jgi:hypothetical protein
MATNNAINSNIPIEIAKGGTNASSMATTDGVVYYDGTRLVTTAVGTAGDKLTSNGAGVAPTFVTPPSGTVVNQSRKTVTTASITNTTVLSTVTTPTTSNTVLLDSITYTPASSSNVLIFQFSAVVSHSAVAMDDVGFFLFADTTLLSSYSVACANLIPNNLCFLYQGAAGTTSSTVYAVYWAVPTAETGTVNKANYGSTYSYTFIITEVLP